MHGPARAAQALTQANRDARLNLNPRIVTALESRRENLIALGVEHDDDVASIRRGVFDEHAHTRHSDDLRAGREGDRLAQGDADAQAGERTGPDRDVQLLDIFCDPISCAALAVDDGKQLCRVLQAVRKLLFRADCIAIEQRD